MKHMACSVLVLLLVLPVAKAQDPPKSSAQEQYQTLLKEFAAQRTQLSIEARQAQAEERQKIVAKNRELGQTYAEKFFKLAQEHPQDPVATDAYFWIVQNGTGSPVFEQALDKVKTAVATIPLAELPRRVQTVRHPALLEAVLARVEKEPQATQTPDLLGWVATSGSTLPVGQKALDLLVANHSDHQALEQACMMLARSRAPQAVETLQRILETAKQPGARAAAALALGQRKAAEAERLVDTPAASEKAVAEAEKYFAMVINEFGKDAPKLKASAERASKTMHASLKALTAIKVGKEAPEITAQDLDGKEFKLSDYRGKVVLLDFWGNW
jgi:hypothetical protein